MEEGGSEKCGMGRYLRSKKCVDSALKNSVKQYKPNMSLGSSKQIVSKCERLNR